MYDMYPWNQSADAEPARDAETPAKYAAPAIAAVQFALDRRDNGGEPAGTAGQPAAGRTRQSRQ